MKEYRMSNKHLWNSFLTAEAVGVFAIISRKGIYLQAFGVLCIIFGFYALWRNKQHKIILTDTALIHKHWHTTKEIPYNLMVAIYIAKRGERKEKKYTTAIRYATNRDARKRAIREDIWNVDLKDLEDIYVLKIPSEFENYKDLMKTLIDRVDDKVLVDEFTYHFANN